MPLPKKGYDLAVAEVEKEKFLGIPADQQESSVQVDSTTGTEETNEVEDTALSGGPSTSQEPTGESVQEQTTRVTPDQQVQSQQEKVDLTAPFPFSLQRKGKDFSNLSYKDVVAYAQMGLNHDIKGRELNQLQVDLQNQRAALSEETQSLQALRDFDQWMRSDPNLAKAVEDTVISYQRNLQSQQSGQSGIQGQPVARAQPVGNDPRVDEMYKFIQDMQTRMADEKLDQLMGDLRRDHNQVQWDVPDPHDNKGRTPEEQIYDFMAEHRVNDPKVAYRALFYDHDIARREQAAKAQVAQAQQKKHQAGVVMATKPVSQSGPTPPNWDNLKGMRHEEIGAQLQRMLESGQLPL